MDAEWKQMKRLCLLVVCAAAVFARQAHKVEIISFTVKPATIHPGQSAFLEWKTRGVDKVAIDWTGNNPKESQHRSGLPPIGTLEVNPKVSTRYMLSCESEEGYACASLSVTVEVR